jgi:tetratricopeptide (TPR) repeat protein
LAEYYSAYELLDGTRRARYGKPLARHTQYLRQHLRRNTLLPLSSLLGADRSSSFYNDQSKRHLFYAQSWALVHYLVSDQSGERGQQLTRYLELTSEGRTNDDAIRSAFHLEPAALESRLAAYVRAGRYQEQEKVLAKPPTVARAPDAHLPEVRTLTEAESAAQLGDLLFRTDRFEEAHQYLERALKLDANLASARITLALLYLREGRQADAKAQLQAAISAAPLNYLAHYYYADLLRRDCADAENTPAGFIARTALIKAEINEAIKLAPDFTDAYGLLVLTNIERSPQLDEATKMLERLLRQSPASRELRLLQVQLSIRQEKFTEARSLLQPLLDDPQISDSLHLAAQEVFNDLQAKEKISQARQAENEGETTAPATGEWQPCDMPEPGPQFKSLRFAGRQTCGRLERVECENEGITLFVKAGERTLRLHTIALNNIRFVTYTKEISGRIECGVRRNPDAVLVTYQQPQHSDQTFDGELKAVEFVPEDWLQEK